MQDTNDWLEEDEVVALAPPTEESDWLEEDEEATSADSWLDEDTIVASSEDDWLEEDDVVEKPEMSVIDIMAGGSMDLMESALGIGDELGAAGGALGGSVYDLFNTDKSLGEIISDNFKWSQRIDEARGTLDNFEEQYPTSSGILTGAGIVGGLFVPGATVAKGVQAAKAAKYGQAAQQAGLTALEGAAYGAASGRDTDGRAEGAVIGGTLGGVLGGGAKLGTDALASRAARKAAEANEITVVPPRMSDEGFADERVDIDINTGDELVDETVKGVLNNARQGRERARTEALLGDPKEIAKAREEEAALLERIKDLPARDQDTAMRLNQQLRNAETPAEKREIQQKLDALAEPTTKDSIRETIRKDTLANTAGAKQKREWIASEYKRLEGDTSAAANKRRRELEQLASRPQRNVPEYEDELAKTEQRVPGEFGPDRSKMPRTSTDNQYLSPEQLDMVDEALGAQARGWKPLREIAKDYPDEGRLSRQSIENELLFRSSDELDEILGSPFARTRMDAVRDITPEDVSGFTGKFTSVMRPMIATMRRNVGEGFGNAVNRGLMLGQRRQFHIDHALGSQSGAARFNQLFNSNKEFAAAVLNQSNTDLLPAFRQMQYDKAANIAKEMGYKGFDEAMAEIGQVTDAINRSAGDNLATSFGRFERSTEVGKPVYMHVSQAPKPTRGRKLDKSSNQDQMSALAMSTRKDVSPEDAHKFNSPFESHRSHLNNLSKQAALAKSLNLEIAGAGLDATKSVADYDKVVNGSWLAEATRNRLKAVGGYTPEQIEEAVEAVKTVTVHADTSMPAELQFLRNWTYFSLLAKPFSAVLNASEIGNIMVTQGIWNTTKALGATTLDNAGNLRISMQRFLGNTFGKRVRDTFEKAYGKDASKKAEAFDAEVQGLVQTIHNDVVQGLPTGQAVTGSDYARRAAEVSKRVLDRGMAISGTKAMDLGVKETALRAAFNKGRAAVKSDKGTRKFMQEQKTFFADDELVILVDAMKKLGAKGQNGEKTLGKWLKAGQDTPEYRMAQLVLDHNMLQLNRMQPTVAADMPEWALRTPSGRVLYIFMNYAVKQADFIAENTIQEVRKGNIKGAAAFAARYAVLTGGMTGAVLEGRDYLWKEAYPQLAGQEGTENSTPSTGPFPEDWSIGNKILWRSGLALSSNLSMGLGPMSFGYYGTDAFTKNPAEEIATDRLVAAKPLAQVYEAGKELVKGEVPKTANRLINPFSREVEPWLKKLWEEAGFGPWME